MATLTLPNKAVTVSNEVGCTVGVTLNITGPLPVSDGDTTTFELQVIPTAPIFSADISVNNDDPDESPYLFTITGSAEGVLVSKRLFGSNVFQDGESSPVLT